MRSRSVAGADVSALLIGAAIFAVFFFLTLYLQLLKGYSPVEAGLAFLPMTLVIGVGAGIAANLLGRVGPRPLLVGGLLTAAAGLLLLTRISPEATYVGIVLPGLLIVALGMGFAFVSLTSAAVAGVPAADSGIPRPCSTRVSRWAAPWAWP